MNAITKSKISLLGLLCLCLLPAYGKDKDTKAVYELIERVTPGYSSQYRLEIIAPDKDADVYEVDGNGKKIILRGNTPVAEGDEISIVNCLFAKYLQLSQEYYAGGVKVTEQSQGGRTYENLGEE